MTIQTFVTSPAGAPSKSVTYVVDATAAPETVSVPLATTTQSNGWPEFDRITVIKKDASANDVTIEDLTPTALGLLEAQDDSMTLFCDSAGGSWRIESNASSTDAGTVAGALAAHETETEVHGATGDVTGVDDVEALIVGAAVVQRITEIQTTDVTDAKVVTFTPGSATPVNSWVQSASGAGDPVTFSAIGTDTDISQNFAPKGAGTLQENGTSVALSTADVVADADDSVEATSPTVAEFNALVTQFNLLLAAARTGRLIAP